MAAPRKAALFLGLGALAVGSMAGWAQEPPAQPVPAEQVAGDASPAFDDIDALLRAEAPASEPAAPLRDGTGPDRAAALAPEPESPAPQAWPALAPAEPAPVPASLPASEADETPRLPAEAPAAPAGPAAVDPGATASTSPAEPAAAPAAPVPDTGAAPAASAPQPEAPTAAAPASPLGAALAARLGEDKPLHPRLARREREAVAAFYALGNYQPVWVRDGAWTPAASRIVERLRGAAEDGLDAGEYPVPALDPAAGPAEIAEAELKLAAAAVLYARDARGGRLEPSRLSGLITPKLDLPAADQVLTALAAAPDAGAALHAYNPPHAGYRALRAKLAELRAARGAQPLVQVPDGPVLRPGMQDSRVPLIRARFNLGPSAEDPAYDEQVAAAVAAFQRENGLKPDGQLTRQTVAALGSRSPARLEADLLANMERWRWLPADLGARHILVNIPEYRLRVVDNGQVAHQTRVVVGKPETPTPVFTGAMEYAIVNPSWFVPPSILNKEFKGANGQITARAGYEVIRRGNQVSVRQPPGPRNALGNIKFMFPNQHAVYLHDTPSRHLFSAERRAFSHGCVRVDQPFALGAQLFAADGWSEARLKGLVGYGERTIKLTTQVPVHITYFTVQVDESGQLRSLDDLYGHNARVKRALGLGGEASVAAPRPASRVSQPRAARPQVARKPVRSAQAAPASRPAPAPRPVQAAAPPSPPPAERSLFGWLSR